MRECDIRLTLTQASFRGGRRIPSTGTSKTATQASALPFLHSLNILVKYVRLYGFDHRRTRAQFRTAWDELRAAVPKQHGSVVLGVSDDKLLVDGVPVETGHAERGFAQLLTTAGIGSIQFSSEVTVEEFEDFVRAFSFSSARAQDFDAHI